MPYHWLKYSLCPFVWLGKHTHMNNETNRTSKQKLISNDF